MPAPYLKDVRCHADSFLMVSDRRRADDRVRILAAALAVPLDLDAVSSEVAGRTRLAGSQDRRAVKALLVRVVDEPYYTDDL